MAAGDIGHNFLVLQTSQFGGGDDAVQEGAYQWTRAVLLVEHDVMAGLNAVQVEELGPAAAHLLTMVNNKLKFLLFYADYNIAGYFASLNKSTRIISSGSVEDPP